MGIFKDYDLRGKYPSEIDEEFAYTFGRAFVTHLKCKNVVVGRDARLSAPKISEALIKGLIDQGANVTDAGLVSTPLLYYLSAKHSEFDGAIMVTASHNPKDYIGFKLCGKQASFINIKHGSLEIKKIMEEDNFEEVEKGTVKQENYYDEYSNFIKQAAKLDLSGTKIIIDTCNGSVGPVMKKIIEKLDLDAKELYFEPDGNFPNHPPNPLEPESQKEIKKELENGNYKLGVIIDADGDRSIFFDEKGNFINSSSIITMLAEHYYDEGERKPVALDVLCYRKTIIDALKKIGVKAVPSPVGYAHVKDALIKNQGMIGAEFSGHYQHSEVDYCDNSALSIVKVLTCLAKTGKNLSELVEELESKSLLQINLEVEEKDEKIKLVEEHFKTETLHIDGVSKTFEDYWFNIRKSNTEPLLRITVEAETKEKAEEILKNIREVIGV